MNHSLSLLEDLFKQIIGPFAATEVASLMIEPDSSEERVQRLVNTFNKYPQYIDPFKTLIRSVNPQEVDVSLEENIRFYSTKHTRNWLVVNLFNHVLNIKELTLNMKTGRLPGKPNVLLKYSNQSLSYFGEESRYKDYVYAAGLIFDFMYYLQRTNLVNLGNMKFDEPINQAFEKTLNQSKVILSLSKHKSKLTLEPMVPVTAYLRQLSMIALHLLRPSLAPEFYKKFTTLKHTESVRLAMEKQTFGIHTGMISAYLIQSIPEIAVVGEAMSIWGFPYLSWLSDMKEAHDLSGMGLLGVSISERKLRASDFPGDGKVRVTIPELENFDFDLNAKVKDEAKI